MARQFPNVGEENCMTQILPFPLSAPLVLRRNPRLRLMAALVLVLFSAAVIWTTIVSAGGYCLTTDTYGSRELVAPR